jgi:ABC-type transporter Mla subunit MlaD
MKSQNRSHYIIGTMVILCSVILLGAMTIALSGYSWRAGGRTLAIEFHDATGIKVHSAVKFAGKTAGSVTRISYLSPEERSKTKDWRNAVRVEVLLDDDVPPLLEGLAASLNADTLLGEKFIALQPGRPDAPALAERAVIQGSEMGSIDSVARSAQETLETANDILKKLKSDYPGLVPRLAELLNQGNMILAQGSNLVNNADTTILNANGAVTQLKVDYNELVPRLNSLFARAQSIATNADQAVLKVSTLLERTDAVVQSNEANLTKLLQELRVAAQNLKVVTTYAKTLTATLAEKPSNLIWGRKKNELPKERTILESAEPVPLKETQ